MSQIKSVVEWARAKRTPEWLFRATAACERWEISEQVDPTVLDEDAYDEAIHRVEHGRL